MRDYETSINPDTLATVILMPTAEKIARDVQATIARDHEGKVSAALIALGWCPPAEAATALSALAEAIDAATRKGVAVNWDHLTATLVRAHDALAKLNG